MRRLSVTFTNGRFRANRERGAVAVITAVITMFVVIGVLALSIDVGRMTYERSQLQNGADATAMALGSYCGQKPTPAQCTSDPTQNQLEQLAGLNAADGKTDLSDTHGGAPFIPVCFHSAGSFSFAGQPPCAAPPTTTEQLDNCLPLPTWVTSGFPYVETRARTLESSDSTLLPSVFAKALTGSDGTTHMTCARATWGPPKSYSGSIPLTFSACEWDNFTHMAGFVWPTPPSDASPGYGGAGQPAWPPVAYEKVIKFQDGDKSAPCTYSNGKDGPGGFGDVQPLGGVCSQTVQTGGWLLGDNGKSVDVKCRAPLAAMRGHAVLVPVFDCLYVTNFVYTGPKPDDSLCQGKTTSTVGGTYNYHIKGWAKFYLSGYVFPSDEQKSYVSKAFPCASSESCISGWFLTGELAADSISEPGGDTDFGTYAVVPAG